MNSESNSRQSTGHHDYTTVAHAGVVSPAVRGRRHPNKANSSATISNVINISRPGQSPSNVANHASSGMESFRASIIGQGFSSQASDLIMDSWRKSTQKQYGHYLKRWSTFCQDRNIDPVSPSVGDGCDFLVSLYNQGLGYSAINSARSALSACLHISGAHQFGDNPNVVKLMRGIFNHRPTQPSIVLTYLKAQTEQSLKTLTLKLTMLLALHTAQRGQTLHMLDLNFITITGDSAVFTFETPLKHEKVGKPRFPVKLEAVKDKDICAVNILKIYISRTMELRNGETRLLISYNKPHRGVSRDTIRRCIIQTIHKSGVNTVFGAHTTRSASTSAALRNNISLNVILSAAQWSSSRTFQKFYNKPLV